jgi:hypothetical protein
MADSEKITKYKKKCAVKGCQSKGDGVKMHRIPWQSENERADWLRFLRDCGTATANVGHNATVCSLHFPDGIRTKGSVPCLFLSTEVIYITNRYVYIDIYVMCFGYHPLMFTFQRVNKDDLSHIKTTLWSPDPGSHVSLTNGGRLFSHRIIWGNCVEDVSYVVVDYLHYIFYVLQYFFTYPILCQNDLLQGLAGIYYVEQEADVGQQATQSSESTLITADVHQVLMSFRQYYVMGHLTKISNFFAHVFFKQFHCSTAIKIPNKNI